MTEKPNHAGIPAQPNHLGVHSLDHFTLSVPDLDEGRDFFSAFGLNVCDEGGRLALQTFGSDHCWARLTQGPTKRLHHLTFGIFEEDLQPFKTRFERDGLSLQSAPLGFESDGIWVNDPDGTRIELRVAPKTSPGHKPSCELHSSPPGKRGATSRSRRPRTRPTRLAHCLLFTANVQAAISFYQNLLGLRLSDRSGDNIAFLHGIHGSDHHLIAFYWPWTASQQLGCWVRQ